MNKIIRQLGFGLFALYLILFGALIYWQVVSTERLSSEEGNNRAILRQYERPRGIIVTSDGIVAAQSRATPEAESPFQRIYPQGDLYAHLTGYFTLRLGSTQLERLWSDELTGDTAAQQLLAVGDLIGGRVADTSGSVRLSLRHDLQTAARTALGEREGSVVVLDVETGAVLAMWSWPSFDPNIVADPDYDTAYAYLDELINDDRDPLLANAYQQRYMPGSTMKVLTTSVALANQTTSLEQTWPEEAAWLPPQTNDPIQNYGGSVCGGDLTEVFRRSCNIPFAQLAINMGPDAFALGMSAWGVGTPVPIDLPRPAASTIGDDLDTLNDNLPLLAMRGFGQNEVQLVPLHLAMITAAVADGGVMRVPYVVDEVLDHTGGTLFAAEPAVWREPISPAVANTMVGLMETVATSGTASCCIGLNGGITIAAKTGTAQLNGPGEPERSHAWITAFAPVEQPRYAITVMVKGTTDEISASTGGRLAGPIAKTVLDTAFANEN